MQSLAELAGAVYYPQLEYAPISAEDKKINRLMIKPLQDFVPEDIRLLIERKLYLEHILPMALNILQKNMWIKAKFYEGDLFVAVCELLPHNIPEILHNQWKEWINYLVHFKNSADYKNISDNIIQRKITLCIKKHT